MSPLSLNLFLAQRSWNGLVVCHAPSHNAVVLSAPREQLAALLDRHETEHSAVYLLTGPNTNGTFGLEGYVGESDRLRTRLRTHDRKKAFWNRAYVATAKDGWLSKSQIRFLEAALLERALQAPLLTKVCNDRVELQYRLPDEERANLNDYLGMLALIMPAIGCPLYSFSELKHPSNSYATPKPAETAKFALKVKTACATGYESEGSFWVRAGSTARKEELSSLRNGYRDTRRDLQHRGLLIPTPDGSALLLTQDVPFNSPSDAAQVLTGTSVNGRQVWKVQGSNKTYEQWATSPNGKN